MDKDKTCVEFQFSFGELLTSGPKIMATLTSVFLRATLEGIWLDLHFSLLVIDKDKTWVEFQFSFNKVSTSSPKIMAMPF